MEKLDPTQRTAVSKMSTERLRIKLGKADFDEQLVSEMSREQLLDVWAKCILEGRDKPPCSRNSKGSTNYRIRCRSGKAAFSIRNPKI